MVSNPVFKLKKNMKTAIVINIILFILMVLLYHYELHMTSVVVAILALAFLLLYVYKPSTNNHYKERKNHIYPKK